MLSRKIFYLISAFIVLILGVNFTSSYGLSATAVAQNPETPADTTFIYLPVIATPLPRYWSQTYFTISMESFNDVTFTHDRRIIAIGNKRVENRGAGWVVKLTQSGEILWQKQFPPGFNFKQVKETTDGSYFLIGEYSDSLLVVKLSGNGSVDWAKSYGELLDPIHVRMVLSEDDGYILAADTEQFQALDRDIWLLKADRNGNIIWQKTFGTNDKDWIDDLDTTANHDIVLIGTRLIINEFDHYFYSVLLFKLNASGNLIWQKEYVYCGAPRIVVLDTGELLLAGSNSFGNGIDGCVAKFNSQGDLLWFKSYGTAEYRDNNFKEVREAANGDYLIAGSRTLNYPQDEDGLLMRLGPDGNIIWQKSMGGHYILGGGGYRDYFNSLDENSDGEIVVSGATNSFREDPQFDDNGWLTMLDRNGNISDCPSLENHGAVVQARSFTLQSLSLTVRDTAVAPSEIVPSPENADAMSNYICPQLDSTQNCSQSNSIR